MGGIAVIVKGWPRLSETFIAQEIEALEQHGLALELWALRRPTDAKRHPVHDRIKARVNYLPEYLYQAPRRVFAGWRKARRLKGYRSARRQFWRDLLRDPTPNRLRRWGQALVLAAELPESVRHLYAHFIHTPASVARYAATMRGLTFSVSAHARDIWTTPAWELAEKIEAARFVTTCTQSGFDVLKAARDASTLHLIPHGVDTTRWSEPETERPPHDGHDEASTVTLLSVGRAVEKKGYDDLIAALALLPKTLHWRFVHIGGGELLPQLKAQAASLGIADRLAFRGSETEDAVREAMRAADLFVLASRVARDGDRDGIPNVLAEAQSQKLVCVATRVGGIPELIEDHMTGRLVAPGDRQALTHVVAELIANPILRSRLGEAGCARVRRGFAFGPGVAQIAALLQEQIS